MQTQKETGAKATVKDFRREVDGKENAAYGKDTEVTYDYEYEILENDEELRRKFAPDSLLKLANGRLKSTANSAARQKAVAQYELTGDDLAREEAISSVMKLNKKMSREQAAAYVDGARSFGA